MNDVLGRPVKVGDTIVRAQYARDSSLHFGKVIEVKDKSIKIERYYHDGNGGLSKANSSWRTTVKTQFLILDNLKL